MRFTITDEGRENWNAITRRTDLKEVELNPASVADHLAEARQQHPEESQGQILGRALGRAWCREYPLQKEDSPPNQYAPVVLPASGRWERMLLWGWRVLVLVALWLIFGAVVAHAQVDVLRVEDEGITAKQWAGGLARLNFTGGGITCTFNGTPPNPRVNCNVPTGGGGASWDALTNPLANQSLAMGAFTTNWTWGAATGAGINLLTFTDTLNNTGTGYGIDLNTASGSALKKIRICHQGTANCIVVDTNILTVTGSAQINATHINGVTVTGTPATGQVPIASSGTAAAWGDPLVSGIIAHDAAGATTNPVLAGCYANAAAPADVSADVDAVREWCLRNGSQVMNLASGGTLVTIGQKAMANSLPVAIASDQSAVPVSGTITANAGSGTFTVSGTVTANAGTGTFTNQQTNVTEDYDTGAGTQNVTKFGIALPASGGSVAGGTATNPVRTDPTGTTTQPVSGTVTGNQGTAAAGSGAWPVTVTDTANTVVKPGDAANNAVRVNIIAGAGSGGTAAADNSVFTGGTTNVTPMGALFDATPPTITDGNVGAPRMNSSRQLMVDCVAGCTAGGSFADNSAFTFGTTSVSNMGAVVDDTATNTVAENSAGAPRMNTNRILYSMNTNSTGTEVGTSGAPLRVDPTGTTTQPVSAASLPLPAGASTSAKQPALGTAGSASADVITVQGIASMTKLLVTPDSVALPANQSVNLAQVAGTGTVTAGLAGTLAIGGTTAHDAAGSAILPTLDGCYANAAAPADVSADLDATRGWCLRNGARAIQPTFAGVLWSTGNGTAGTGTPRVTIASDNTAFAVNATLSAETTKVIGTVRAQGNLGAAFDAASGAAPPANRVAIGGLTSGATAGFMVSPTYCDSFANINVVTATTTLIVTGVSGRHVRICSWSFMTAGANNVAFISGTGATCGTGTTGMNGGTTSATGFNFAANQGMTQGSGLGEINRTNATGDSVCVITSAAVQLSGRISYAIY